LTERGSCGAHQGGWSFYVKDGKLCYAHNYLSRATHQVYTAPFPFTGNLHTVTVDLSGELITDTDSELRMAMVRQ